MAPSPHSLLQRPAWQRGLLAGALFAAALGLRWWQPAADGVLGYATFYPAAVLAFWLLGTGPGVALVLAAVPAGHLAMGPPRARAQASGDGMLSTAAFVLTCALAGTAVVRQRRDHQDQDAGQRRRIDTAPAPDVSQAGPALDVHADGADTGQGAAALRALAEREDLLNRTGRLAGVGGWQLDLRSQAVRWSAQTRVILEVAPDFQPTLPSAMAFYGPEARDRISAAIDASARDGAPWDLELPLVTARGRHIWVQARGEVAMVDGQPAWVLGTLQDVSQRRALQAQAAKAAAEAQDLYDNAPCGYYSIDAQGLFVRVNQRTLSWLGCSRDELIGKLGPRHFFSEAGRNFYRLMFPVFMAEGRLGPIEFELRSRDGTVRWVSVSATAVRDAGGGFVMSRSVMYDVTETHEARRSLRRLSAEQDAMLDNELVAMVKLRNRKAVWKNKALEKLFGYSHDELIDQPARLLYCDDASYEALGQLAYGQLAKGGHYRDQIQMCRKDGQRIWVDITGTMVSAEDGESLWMMTDITALKSHQAQVEHMAFHDALTGLPNRLLLSDRMAQGALLCERQRRRMLVCYLDLDGFKAVNDAYGHDVGDLLLQEIARRLQACVRASDTVARIGGDEFVVLLTPLDELAEGQPVVQRVVDAVARPVTLGPGQRAQVSASIGLSSYPDDGHLPEMLLRQADAAMYQHKRQARRLGAGRQTGLPDH